MKAEADKQNIKNFVKVLTNLNNSKTKVDDLDVFKLKIVPIELKRLSDVVSKKVVKNTKFNKLNTKVNSLEDEILMQLPKFI